MRRETGIILHNHIYLLCMVMLPVVLIVFFTSLMEAGQPTDMPVGVVDLDRSATTRTLTRRLDAFQSTRIAAHYHSANEARQAMQCGEIYAFIYFEPDFSAKLMANRQPTLSFYYSNASITAGSLLFKDLKTISTLAQAAVAQQKLSALGKTSGEIRTFLQPIAIDLHMPVNPQASYNYCLSTSLIPACLLLFIFLVSCYSVGTELKFGTCSEWLERAGGNIAVALAGKLLPQTLVFLSIMNGYYLYIFYGMDFPHSGGLGSVVLLSTLSVLSAQCFGVFMFGLTPSVRMSMSLCSLWAALSFSLMGATYPLSAMDSPIAAMAQLFPMRHVFMIYQMSVFNGYPLASAWPHIAALLVFCALPLLVLHRLKKALREWVYIP